MVLAMKKTKFMIINLSLIILLLFSGSLYSWYHYANDNTVTNSLDKIPQNNFSYFNNTKNIVFINSNQQKILAQKFLAHYFSPWQGKMPLDQTLTDIKNNENENLKNLLENPGMGANKHIYQKGWAKSLEYNINIKNFPTLNENAITVKDSNVRLFPTIEPSFKNLNIEGSGYPFDNLQQSYLNTWSYYALYR
jgi:hypothetical protein